MVKLSHCLHEACVVVMLLCFLHKALHVGLLFCNLFVVNLSCCLCEACAVVMLLCCLHKAVVKFQTSSSASCAMKADSAFR